MSEKTITLEELMEGLLQDQDFVDKQIKRMGFDSLEEARSKIFRPATKDDAIGFNRVVEGIDIIIKLAEVLSTTEEYFYHAFTLKMLLMNYLYAMRGEDKKAEIEFHEQVRSFALRYGTDMGFQKVKSDIESALKNMKKH